MHPKTVLRTLAIIHFAFCSGLLLFAAFAYSRTESLRAGITEGDVFVYIVPIVAIVGYFASAYTYRNLTKNLPKEENLQTKLSRYQIASLVRYALIEGPAFLALVAYLLNGTAMFLIIALALIVYLFALRPSLNRMLREVPLNFEEKKQFDTLRP